MLSNVVKYIAAVAALWLVAYTRPHATPVDAALPVAGIILIFLAWVASSVLIEAAVPLLVFASIAIPDDHFRLLAFGIIVAAAFATAAFTVPRTFAAETAVAIGAILVLRWIPLANVEIVRELIVLFGAFTILMAIAGRDPEPDVPANVLAAVSVALVTPTHPGKALLYPFVVAVIVFVVRSLPVAAIVSAVLLVAAHFARASLAPLWFAAAVAVLIPLLTRRRAILMPAYAAAIALFALWPWSGIVARATPRFLRAEPPSPKAQTIGRALAASESIELPVPPNTKYVILTASGANVARLKANRVIGSAGTRPIRIGDVADFGFLRREVFFSARNPLPYLPVADIRGYGQSAFLYGAGRIVLRNCPATLRIAAAPDLPAKARLQVETIEYE